MYIIGADIGTTGTKAILADTSGKIISTSYQEYGLFKGNDGIVEQNADAWLDAFNNTVTECLKSIHKKEDVVAIALSTQGGTMVCVDKFGMPLNNAMVWMDQRSVSQFNELQNLYGQDYFFNKTGKNLSPVLSLCKIKWMKEKNPELAEKTFKYLTTIEYLNFRLTGQYIVDPTNAAMTQLMNIHTLSWDKELLEIIDVSEERLPRIVDSGKTLGTLTQNAANALGLSTNVKVISGGHDQYCAAVGCGVIESGQIMLSTGTAWAVLGLTDNYDLSHEPRFSLAPHIVSQVYGEMSTVPTAGVCMEWLKNNFFDNGESFKSIDEKASDLLLHAKDLLFYPYFINGFPDFSPKGKAAFLGLSLEHTKYDMARAVMEGIAFQIKYILEKYTVGNRKYNNIKVLGGASKSDLWMDILTNVLDIDVYKCSESNAACIGAVIIAGVGSGLFSNYEDACAAFSNQDRLLEKNPEKRFIYDEKYKKYIGGLSHILNYYNLY